jgi:hypothetical protein
MSDITTDFISAIKKLHADIKAVLLHTKLIQEDVKTIRENAVAKTEQQPPEDESHDPIDSIANGVASGRHVKPNESTTDEQDSENRTESAFQEFRRRFRRSRRKPRFWLEVVALLGLFAYTCETRRTNDLTNKGITQSQKNFIFDERPYVWPAKIEPLPMKVGERIMANVYSVNYGRTPAIHHRATGRIFVAKQGDVMTQADLWFDHFSEKSPDFNEGSQVILPPGIPPDVKQYPSHITLQGGIPDDQHAIDVINGTDFSFAIVGIFLYEDFDGNHYRTDFCKMHLAVGTEAWCPRHNEIH